MQYFSGAYKGYRFSQSGRFWKANVTFSDEHTTIAPGIQLIATTSLNMGYFNKYPSMDSCEDCESQATFNGLNELSLSLQTANGEVLFVGCSHSMVERIITETKNHTNNTIELVYGGYHLLPYDRTFLSDLTLRLKNDLKVNNVAPAHCTGHLAFKLLQDVYGENYVFAGLGETVPY